MDPPKRYAKLANEALKKGVKHLSVIIEIACASYPYHLIAVTQAYCSLYDCSLEKRYCFPCKPTPRKGKPSPTASWHFKDSGFDIFHAT